MWLKLHCDCGCDFTLGEECTKTDSPLECPNCHEQVREEVSSELKTLLRSYYNVKNKLGRDFSLTIIPE